MDPVANADLGQITTAPSEITVNGTTYTCDKVTLKTLGQLKQRIRQAWIRSIQEAMKGELDPVSLRHQVSLVAVKPIGPDILQEEMQSPENIAWMFWKLVKPHHKEVELATFENMKVEELFKLGAKLKDASGLAEDEENPTSIQQETTKPSGEPMSPP